MATRAVLQTFERYQKERVAFVTQVAEMARNPQVRIANGDHQTLCTSRTVIAGHEPSSRSILHTVRRPQPDTSHAITPAEHRGSSAGGRNGLAPTAAAGQRTQVRLPFAFARLYWLLFG